MSVADLLVPNPYPLNVNAAAVNVATGGSLTFPSITGSPPALTITNSSSEQIATVDYSGASTQVGAGTLRYYKLGNWVTLNYVQTAAPLAAALINGVITLSVALLPGHRPLVNQLPVCGINLNGNNELGAFSISAATGVMAIGAANGGFVMGQSCGLVSPISISFPVA